MMQRYISKISGPLLDRIDIHIEVPQVQYRELRSAAASEGSAEIRARVLAARDCQNKRFVTDRIFINAQMHTRQIRTYCELSPEAERLLERAMQQQGLSARAHDRILKVARTIADLEAQPNITVGHIAEAIQYRTLDRSYWS
jgi:magnesium chelatase family protein